MIRKNFPNVLSNLYEYDFSSCVYNILNNIGWDLDEVDEEDKLKRNIQIGYIRRDNPRVSVYLENSMKSLIDYYLRINNIKDEEIVLRQKDGLILTKPMKNLNETMSLDFRGVISKLVTSLDRRKWLIIYSDPKSDVTVKGIKNNLYDRSIYNFFRNFNYSNKHSLIDSIEKFRQVVYGERGRKSWYVLKEDDEYIVPIKEVGYMKLRKSTISSLSIEDIDKRLLWEDYLWPFVESIMVYCVN